MTNTELERAKNIILSYYDNLEGAFNDAKAASRYNRIDEESTKGGSFACYNDAAAKELTEIYGSQIITKEEAEKKANKKYRADYDFYVLLKNGKVKAFYSDEIWAQYCSTMAQALRQLEEKENKRL